MAPMHARAIRFALVALAVAAGSATLPAQYSLTVNKDRLINAQNEPQNWLLMNGDYGSLRYSRLTQINRENVKNLRMVWAMALGGMQDVGQNGPENELNPLIDNGFMYTSDGWGTIYKIDARNPGRGSFVWIADPGVQHEGNVTRTRGIALWEDLVIANLPYVRDDRWESLMPEITGYEPRVAITGGVDGLDLIRELLEAMPSGTRVVLEHAEDQGDAIRGLLDDAVSYPDLANWDRITVGRVP